MSLVDRALALSRTRGTSLRPSEEELDLALAFVCGEVSASQAATALATVSRGGMYSWAFLILRRSVAAGTLVMTKKAGGR